MMTGVYRSIIQPVTETLNYACAALMNISKIFIQTTWKFLCTPIFQSIKIFSKQLQGAIASWLTILKNWIMSPAFKVISAMTRIAWKITANSFMYALKVTLIVSYHSISFFYSFIAKPVLYVYFTCFAITCNLTYKAIEAIANWIAKPFLRFCYQGISTIFSILEVITAPFSQIKSTIGTYFNWTSNKLFTGITYYLKFVLKTWKPAINLAFIAWENCTAINFLSLIQSFTATILHPFLGIVAAYNNALLPTFTCICVGAMGITAPFFTPTLSKQKAKNSSLSTFLWAYTSLSISTFITLSFFEPKSQTAKILSSQVLKPLYKSSHIIAKNSYLKTPIANANILVKAIQKHPSKFFNKISSLARRHSR
ncbi:MAG: hypothetical protein VX112_01050 [Pseudomonadota bacterium]|nr:hypothetical protein [Pseudomonadota bacterium]